MSRIGWAIGVVMGVGAWMGTLDAQEPIRLETRHGILEVMGLKDWTVERLNTTLVQRLGPKYSLDGRACGAFLHAIGLPDNEVRLGRDEQTGLNLWSITIVEPGDRAPAAPGRQFVDSLPKSEATEAFERMRSDGVWVALGKPDWVLGEGRDTLLNHSTVGQMLRSWVREHQDSSSQAWARWTVLNDRNPDNRMAAVAMLVGGVGDDSTYYVLAEALLDPYAGVSANAGQSLRTLSVHEQRQVLWAPALGALERVVAGKNLWIHQSLYQTLALNPPDPATSRAIALAGEELLMLRLGSGDALLRESAHRFLVAAAGMDFGVDQAKWRAWIRSLRPTSRDGVERTWRG